MEQFDQINTQVTLESEIEAYIETLPAWSKYLSRKIYSGQQIIGEDLQTAYKYFREVSVNGNKSFSLPEDGTTTTVQTNAASAAQNNIYLSKLTHREGVNALRENESISFSPTLTVIFGENGAGKSGYTRLLKHAFFSRSKEDIKPNIFDIPKTVSGAFVFKEGDTEHPKVLPGNENDPEFKRFTVFDNRCVLLHLDNENTFEFRPAKLDFFSDLVGYFTKMQVLLQVDIDSRLERTFSNLFDGVSAIKNTITVLSQSTNISDIKKFLPTEADDIKLKELEQRKAALLLLKKDKEIAGLEEKIAAINLLMRGVEQSNKMCEEQLNLDIVLAIKDYNAKSIIVKDEGIESFQAKTLEEIGSSEWKTFIQAGQKFADKQKNKPYPKQGDACIFCQQELKEDAIALISNYWTHLKSKAETAAATALETLNNYTTSISAANFMLLAKESLIGKFISEKNNSLFDTFNLATSKQIEYVKNILSCIQGKDSKAHSYYVADKDGKNLLAIDIKPIEELRDSVQNELDELQAKDPKQELETVEVGITFIKHKKVLSSTITEIEDYLDVLKLKSKETSAKSDLNTRTVTSKEKELSQKYFGKEYDKVFQEECSELHGKKSIQLTQRSEKGASYKELKIAGHVPSTILSESEQKVISLSDFLAETRMSSLNRGIIFDDPVTSFDENRKSIIAERLVKESTKRQVIVFTHDRVFLSAIISECEDQKLPLPTCHWVEAENGEIGKIWENNSPSLEDKYKSPQIAQDYCNKAKGLAPQDREQILKDGFTALRTSYEVLLVYGLFNGVVRRFDKRVRFDALKEVPFDVTVRDELMDGYINCCDFMEGHSHSDQAVLTPTVSDLQKEIDNFIAIKKTIKDLKEAQKKKIS